MGASSGGVRVRRASRKRASVVTGPAGLPGRRLVGRGGFGWPRSRCGDLGGSQGKRLALECGNVLSLRQVLVQGPKDQFELELTTRQDLGRSHFLRLALATTSIRKPALNRSGRGRRGALCLLGGERGAGRKNKSPESIARAVLHAHGSREQRKAGRWSGRPLLRCRSGPRRRRLRGERPQCGHTRYGGLLRERAAGDRGQDGCACGTSKQTFGIHGGIFA